MNMTRTILIAILIFITGSAASQKVLTLEEAISIAIKNNLDVAQTGLQADVAAINLRQAKNNKLPTINGTITHGINQGRSIDPFSNAYINQKINYAAYGLGGDLILFNGLTLKNAIRQNAFAFDASKMDLEQAKDNLRLAVILAYLQVLSNEDQVGIAKKQIEVTQAQLDRLEKLNKEGAISPPQLYDIKGQLKEAELNEMEARNAWAASKLQLCQLMTLPYDANLQLQRVDAAEMMEKFPLTLNDVMVKAAQSLAGIKAADLRIKSAEAAVRLSKGALLPTLSLGSNLNTNFSSAASREIPIGLVEKPTESYILVNGSKQHVIVPRQAYKVESISYGNQFKNNVFSNIGLSLRVPIFNSHFNRNRVKLAELNLKAADLDAQNTRVQLRQEIEQAYLNMNNAWERYGILVEQVEAYSESFRAAEVRFAAGVGTSVDYVIAKNNLDRAQINLVNAKYDYLLRKKVLLFYSEERSY